MAIEILSKNHPSVAKICICRNCGAELKYFPVDIKKIKSTDYTGCTDTYNTIKCPNCTNTLYVS